MFEVTTDRRRGAVVADLDRMIDDAEELLARESVVALEGPRSKWPDVGRADSPYATGRSKASFLWRRRGGGIVITNTARSLRGYRYPLRVNNDPSFAGGRHFRAVQRTIDAEWRNIVRRVRRRLS